MFSAGKKLILNTLGILCIPHNFWHYERLWIFISTTWCFTQVDIMRNESTSRIQVYIEHYDFMMNRELNFSVARNDFGCVLICWWVTLFLRVSYWGQVIEINFCLIKLLKILSFPASWVICNADVLPYWDILLRKENLKSS